MTKRYGNNEVEGDLDFDKAKIKVTMYLDGDLLKIVKNEAEKKGKKYQTLLNKAMREYFLKDDSLERKVEKLEARLSLLEAK